MTRTGQCRHTHTHTRTPQLLQQNAKNREIVSDLNLQSMTPVRWPRLNSRPIIAAPHSAPCKPQRFGQVIFLATPHRLHEFPRYTTRATEAPVAPLAALLLIPRYSRPYVRLPQGRASSVLATRPDSLFVGLPPLRHLVVCYRLQAITSRPYSTFSIV